MEKVRPINASKNEMGGGYGMIASIHYMDYGTMCLSFMYQCALYNYCTSHCVFYALFSDLKFWSNLTNFYILYILWYPEFWTLGDNCLLSLMDCNDLCTCFVEWEADVSIRLLMNIVTLSWVLMEICYISYFWWLTVLIVFLKLCSTRISIR